MNIDRSISIDIDYEFEKRYKFEILQHTLLTIQFFNFASRSPLLNKVKLFSAQRTFYLKYVRIRTLFFHLAGKDGLRPREINISGGLFEFVKGTIVFDNCSLRI